MVKTLTAAALLGAMSLATVPALTSAAFAQAAGPEPMQGATPMDNGGGGAMSKGSGDQGAMGGQDSMSKKKMSKHKKHMKHSKRSM